MRPPLSTGAVHERLIVSVPLAVAVSPVGASGATAALVELLVTAGTLFMPVVKDAASLPAAVLDGQGVVAGGGVGVGDDDDLALADDDRTNQDRERVENTEDTRSHGRPARQCRLQ